MTEETERKYRFSWDLLGDIESGRPNLGRHTSLEVYRLMQFSFRDVLEKNFGTEEADRVFREAGYLAGSEFYDHLVGPQDSLGGFISKLQTVLKERGIGILRVEESDPAAGRFVITVAEDLDCSGMPETGNVHCTYDVGFIAALLERFAERTFTVREIDCWNTGERTCRFSARMAADE